MRKRNTVCEVRRKTVIHGDCSIHIEIMFLMIDLLLFHHFYSTSFSML